MDKRASRISTPALLHGTFADAVAPVDVLFWSGGKDSFLAARALAREHRQRGGSLLLLTTFDAANRQVAHQEINIELVVRQAQALKVPLLGVPLWPHIGYVQRMHDAFELLRAEGVDLHRVCNGDLHLEYVGQWRVDNIAPVLNQVFGESAPSLHAPLWRVPYAQLAADLAASTVPCRVCAVTGEHGVKVGDLFDAALLARLDAATCDQFGENGEFHTLAEVWEATADPLGRAV